MMYPMALANIMFQVMGDDMGFVPNGYVVIFVVPPSPPRQGSVGIVSHGLSDGRSAMTKADMMNYMGDRAMMENGGARKHGAPDDQSCKRSIERCHRRMIKNRESATRSCARKQSLSFSILQAYTVELEAELNHLKEENARLKAEEKTILLTKKKNAGGEDDGAAQGERERQEGWRLVAALRQLHLVKGDLPFNFHSRAGKRMRMNCGYLSFLERVKKILLTKKQMLVEKMIEQSKENVNAKKGGTLSRCCGNCIW
ncbi:unnamed protein product [Triticum turgidum subsp. durum]|uniref:BZIP domain-containing protein n=2 Tax=Triticum TaxID=4564 RepID=A0A9R1QTT0_TRITD|nr:unnamed protein product [Triticum aestivum]VAH82029.1 unnamed protein product [Triticum turgidum subsp. durum]